MKRVFSLLAVVWCFFSLSGAALLIDPSALTKSMGPYDLVTGDYPGQPFWDYSIGDEIKFSVVQDLVNVVDALIDQAKMNGTMVNHVDSAVFWFFEQGLIEKFLVVAKD